MHTCNPGDQKAEAEQLGVQSQTGLPSNNIANILEKYNLCIVCTDIYLGAGLPLILGKNN